ncbi:MAG: phenylalanine--tRNA ligase subunit beta [Thermoleophilia bacterium]|nr:phenylalanine--tRNA ligase subunit beta [Thermoleophilia bacterium]
MRIPISWLREYVAFATPLPELAERLAVASAEVERISRRGVPDENGNLGRYVVGRVVEAGKHPNADRLQLCRVDTGDPEPRQIVCGAWNFGAGATVPVALPGAVLPDGRTLERAKLRGAVSEGMILSERELELGTDHAGILVLDEPHEPGTPLADVLPLRDEVLELELTGNRPDLTSIYGMAREVAALVGGELAPPPGADPPRAGDEPLELEIYDLEGCPRYVGRLFRGVRLGPSPPWLKARLVAAGMRPISNVVDVTNYVMLALGSPLHAFDHARLAGGRIGVRRAHPGEELVTLDGVRRRLDPADLLITDAREAVAIAGIMGGLDSEVTDATTEVLLEAASFEPVGILGSSERLGLRSEASNRWEKGVDPYLCERAAVLASQLLVELAGGRFVAHRDVHGELPPRPVTRLRPARVSALVGLEIPEGEQRAILERLGFDVTGDWEVTVPTWRARDVTREIDLVEEVARVYGLERVPFTLPERRAMFGRLSQAQRLRRLVEDVMTGCGLSEAYTWSLAARDPDPRALRLPVPLSAEHALLRTMLVEGLVAAAARNVDAGNERVDLFEVARVYLPSGEQLPDERWQVGGICEGGYFRAKGIVETLHAALGIEPVFERTRRDWLHPGRAASVDAGWVGELHPALLDGIWGVFQLDLETLFAEVPERILYDDVITYPALRQDLAFVVAEDVPAGELVRAARDLAGRELREARVFDVYRGGQIPAGRKSVAIRVAFQSPERTLTDEEAAGLRGLIVAGLAERFGAELRAG